MRQPKGRGSSMRLLFVCTGNICRSPTAEGVVRQLARDRPDLPALEVESAGITGYHVGEPPDPRARGAAAQRGYDLGPGTARKLARTDFQRFDLLLAMDKGHLRQMQRLAPDSRRDRVRLFLDFANTPAREIPDPYYGGAESFETMLDLIEAGAHGLLTAIAAGELR